MPVAVGFAPPDAFVIRATGRVTYDECQRAIDDVLAHPAGHSGPHKLLVDGRGVVGAPNTRELRAIARDMTLFVSRGYGPMAIVTDTALIYGVARVFAVFARASGMAVRAFLTVDDASEWLKAA
jgi:hypothetical protein